MPTYTKKTKMVQYMPDGVFLQDFGMAYVVDIEEDADFRDRDNIGLTRDKTTLTINNSNGDEGYIILPHDTPVTYLFDRENP